LKVVKVGFIPDEAIETVRQRSDIVEVVSRHVQLKRRGRNYSGLCPFHQDRSPSFTVAPDKQIFHCFGCNTGGDVFKFLMLKENLTFMEAVRQLANQAGILLPVTDSPAEQEKQQKLNRLRQINGLARDFYCEVLKKHEVADPARRYLAGRGITQEVIQLFQIGYAPPGWEYLLKFMKKQKIQPSEVVEAGLAHMKDDNNYYDRFRGRVLFPIWDLTGRVIAFGGRVLGDALPKYLNTPETPLFIKGHNLYGLHVAGKHARDKGNLVIMEGYMDVITAQSFGINNAVAALGTSLTKEQGFLLLNHSRNIVVAFDADAAGAAASLRSLEMLLEIGCQARVVSIPDGKDPDGYLRQHGAKAWETLVTSSLSAIEYVLRQSLGNKTISSVSDKLQVMRLAFPYVGKEKTDVEREESLKIISRTLSISPEAVGAEFKKFKSRTGKKESSKANTDNYAISKHTIISGSESRGNTREKAEKELLRLALEDPTNCHEIIKVLGTKPFKNTYYDKVLSKILTMSQKPEYQPVRLLQALEENEQVLVRRILAEELPFGNPSQRMKDCLALVRRNDLRERRETLLREIGEAARIEDQVLYGRLWSEFVLLKGIAEAERTGDVAQMELLMNDYRQFAESDGIGCQMEGSESAERRT
jgi:DNA primase